MVMGLFIPVCYEIFESPDNAVEQIPITCNAI